MKCCDCSGNGQPDPDGADYLEGIDPSLEQMAHNQAWDAGSPNVPAPSLYSPAKEAHICTQMGTGERASGFVTPMGSVLNNWI